MIWPILTTSGASEDSYMMIANELKTGNEIFTPTENKFFHVDPSSRLSYNPYTKRSCSRNRYDKAVLFLPALEFWGYLPGFRSLTLQPTSFQQAYKNPAVLSHNFSGSECLNQC